MWKASSKSKVPAPYKSKPTYLYSASVPLVIAVVVPTRKDRPRFLQFCKKQLRDQTQRIHHIIIVDDPPPNPDLCDITWRYRIGCRRALDKRCNVIMFWEDDDWYHPTYVQWMISQWITAGSPGLFGVNETYYYHLGARKKVRFFHPARASAFCTLISSTYAQNIKWPKDSTASLDLELWSKGGITIPWGETILAIGIKHNIGCNGGSWHDPKRDGWRPENAKGWFLEKLNPKAKAFYQQF